MKEMTPEGKAAELYPQMDAYGKTLAKRAAFIEGAQWQASQFPTPEAVAVAYMEFVQKMTKETGQPPSVITEAIYQNKFILDEKFVILFCEVHGK